MSEKRPRRGRAISKTQVIGILAMMLSLLFIVSFAMKSYELYRLRAWRAQLQQEIATRQREIAELQLEQERRESLAWVDQALRETGRVPPNVLVVTVLDATPAPVAPVAEAPAATPASRQEPLPQLPVDAWFRNPHWEAWKKLIRQKD